MTLPDTIHTFPQELSHGDDSETIYPIGIELEDGLLLIDPGMEHNLDRLEDELAEAGFSIEDIERILLTHQDPDHAGAAADLARRSGATVLASTDDAPFIDGRRSPIKTQDDRYAPVTVDVELTDGARLQTAAGPLRVIATPGHTPGHLSVYLPEQRLLLAGDALNNEDGLVGPRQRFTPDMDAAVSSLARLADLRVDRIVCFHGGPIEATGDTIASVLDELRDAADGYRTVPGSGPRFLRRELDADRVGLSRFTIPAGDRHGSQEHPDGAHRHSRQQELYLVNTGSGRLKVDDEIIELEEGDAILVEPHAYRAFEADEEMELFAAGAPIADDTASSRPGFWE